MLSQKKEVNGMILIPMDSEIIWNISMVKLGESRSEAMVVELQLGHRHLIDGGALILIWMGGLIQPQLG